MENRNNYSGGLDRRTQVFWEDSIPSIRREFGYSEFLDWSSAVLLNRMYLSGRRKFLDLMRFVGKNAVVFGAAVDPENAVFSDDETVIVADSAVDRLRPDTRVDFVITDLDGDRNRLAQLSASGSILVVHAHGDNIDKLISVFPDLRGQIVISSQVPSFGSITCFGGFTDGDRAAFFAHYLKAPVIRLVGFDFEKPVPKPGTDPETKAKKLAWTRKLIDGLHSIRKESFGEKNLTVER